MQAIRSGLQVSFCLAIRKRIKYSHIKHVPRDRRFLHTVLATLARHNLRQSEADRPAASEHDEEQWLIQSLLNNSKYRQAYKNRQPIFKETFVVI